MRNWGKAIREVLTLLVVARVLRKANKITEEEFTKEFNICVDKLYAISKEGKL